jgi:endonuclease/exonuclease/phosphatase (EEP) superfamily protein YafD
VWADLARETTALSKVREQLQAASAEVDNVVLAGDINLDTARRCDVRYRHRCLMLAHDSAVADANMRYLETGITYRSHGQHVREDGEAREHKSILDHICVSKDLVATVNMLSDTTTDHFPLLTAKLVFKVTPFTKSIERRNFKQLDPPALLRAIETWP